MFFSVEDGASRSGSLNDLYPLAHGVFHCGTNLRTPDGTIQNDRLVGCNNSNSTLYHDWKRQKSLSDEYAKKAAEILRVCQCLRKNC